MRNRRTDDLRQGRDAEHHHPADGSGIRLTTHYYNPPYSDNYNGVGIPADYELEMASSAIADPALDTQLQKALSLLAGSEGSN